MTDTWTTVTASEVQPGDRVRRPDGQEALVTRIEEAFLGREGMIAFIEDTPERWFKLPARLDAEIEVQRAG